MLYTINNNRLSLAVDSLGAQMMSLLSPDGIEYLWQGDPSYWTDRAPVLFPFIGRLTNNSYRYCGKVYPMKIHGFALETAFLLEEQSSDRLVLKMESCDKTKTQYPFDFSLKITYALQGNTVQILYEVNNLGYKTMPFAIGGHPGFNVPLLANERFEDYELEFSCACHPDRVGFSPAVYLNGQDIAYPLEAGKKISLKHALFNEDAVILKNMAREVTLRSKLSGRGVCVAYPQMPYLGIWHMPNTDAPYVCIEPWSSLPSRQDIVEEFSCKSDLIQLAPKEIYSNLWTITVI